MENNSFAFDGTIKDYPWWEQQAIIHLYNNFESVRNKIQVIKKDYQYILNAFPNNFKKNSFLIHFAGIKGNHMKNMINKYYESNANLFHDFDLSYITFE